VGPEYGSGPYILSCSQIFMLIHVHIKGKESHISKKKLLKIPERIRYSYGPEQLQ